MRVRHIHHPEDFDNLRESWQSVYRSDPHTSIFASWGWLRGWIAATSSSWSVLAAIPSGSRTPVAFLPLRVENGRGRLKIRDPAKLLPGGHPLADKSALVCAPGYQADALPALARAVARAMRATGATEFGIPEAADPRWHELASGLPARRFTLAEGAPTPCPLLPLPESWEAYIQGSRKRKAALKHAEEEGFLVTHAEADTLERDIDVFLDLHQLRLGPKSPSYLHLMRSLVEWAFRSGILHMVTLWSDEGEPMASNVAFLDHHREVFHAYNGGWDDWFRDRSPRRVAELYSIRWAIEHGFRVYDFGRGDEQYKFGFGAREGFNANLAVHRRTAVGTARRLASRVS